MACATTYRNSLSSVWMACTTTYRNSLSSVWMVCVTNHCLQELTLPDLNGLRNQSLSTGTDSLRFQSLAQPITTYRNSLYSVWMVAQPITAYRNSLSSVWMPCATNHCLQELTLPNLNGLRNQSLPIWTNSPRFEWLAQPITAYRNSLSPI
jgi:hypothetical protein